VTGGGKAEGLARFFSRFGPRRPEEEPEAGERRVEVPRHGPVFPTKALRKFLACLGSRPDPVVLDVGSVSGSNVSFFAEERGCKVHVADLFSDLDRHTREGRLDAFPSCVKARLSHPDAAVDAILCWDLMDYLDRPPALVLAAELMRILRVDGALLGFFGTVAVEEAHFTRYVIVDDTHLQHRTYPAQCRRHRVLANRDIIKLFGGLRVSDSFLLQSNSREILFHKPSYLTQSRLSG
jgi:hypothetical protein